MKEKLEKAREIATTFFSKEAESLRIEGIISFLTNRTDTEGNITVEVEKQSIKVPAQVLLDVFGNRKDAIDIELEALADKFNGK